MGEKERKVSEKPPESTLLTKKEREEGKESCFSKFCSKFCLPEPKLFPRFFKYLRCRYYCYEKEAEAPKTDLR